MATFGIAGAEHQSALHAGAGEHCGETVLVVIAARDVIERPGRAAELAHHDDQRFIQQGLAGLVFAGSRRQDPRSELASAGSASAMSL